MELAGGEWSFAPGGQGGFGYDPRSSFPDGFKQTFAELGDDVKNRIKPRQKTLAKLRQRLETV